MDVDESGLVEFAEFVRVMVKQDGEENTMLMHSLARFKDGNVGKVSIEENLLILILSN